MSFRSSPARSVATAATPDVQEASEPTGEATMVWWRRLPAFTIVASLVALAVMAVTVYPLVVMLINTFTGEHGGWEPFRKVFENPSFGQIVLNTVLVVGIAGVASVIIGTVFALLTERTDASMGWLTAVLPMLPLLLPPVALSVGWVFLADKRVGMLNAIIRNLLDLVGVHLTTGPFNIGSWQAMVFVYTLYLVPFVFLSVTGSLGSIDPEMEEASRTSGRGVVRTMWHVSLPLLKPAITGAAFIAAIFALSVYSIPAIVGTQAHMQVISVEVVNLTNGYPPQTGQAVVFGLLLLVLLTPLWMAQRRFSASGRHARLAGRAARSSRIRLGAWRPVARAVLIGYILVATVLPFLALLIVALQPFWTPRIRPSLFTLRNFDQIFSDESIAREALTNSLWLGVLGATVGMILAAVLVVFARRQPRALGNLVENTVRLPAAIPHVVIGVAFILAFAGPPLKLYGTSTLLLVSYIVVYLPQASTAAAASYSEIGNELIEASRVAGAAPGRTFGKVVLPLMRPGLIGGWALLFVVMAGDLTVSSLLSGSTNPVVGRVFLDIWEQGTYSQLAAMATVLTAVSAAVVVLVLMRFGKRTGSIRGGS